MLAGQLEGGNKTLQQGRGREAADGKLLPIHDRDRRQQPIDTWVRSHRDVERDKPSFIKPASRKGSVVLFKFGGLKTPGSLASHAPP
ncbi:hypothetical protein BO82DRAFT_352036 [Aspergillus uvarum CBS 121591]|uniref:Uncharacterized protein n=1 Tax=Aspergillus uvarum CBS 121591 TaxID=1448315 RepID=A0A319D0C5_9EURO|nr:hypothetical protein BO82DRAFT_352036 [Aspergillus uvarum CBS 121591]PYH84483.1 hypothetical protein BO82DRAFT_352036 [Aspergillus uvarum CBS 121591]